MSTYDAVADLPLRIEDYRVEGLSLDVSSGFTRHTTVIHLVGRGEEGVGEDVTYDAVDQLALQESGAELPLQGEFTLGSFSEELEGIELFPQPPNRHASVDYRRWAFESAALDLALRQAGTPLHEVLGRTPQPVVFVVSTRATRPAELVERYHWIRFKLDPTPEWTDELIEELVELQRIDCLDLKGQYEGTAVDNPPDPVLYRRVAEAFPNAWLEDPALTAETDPVLEPHRDRVTWDAVIHSVADVEALPFPPRTLNSKPSRFGTIRDLFDFYDYCAEHAIGLYGGGQFELGLGRGQIQYLASLFHSGSSNDVAPGGYNHPEPADDLPASPLEPAPSATGFRWEA